jgi:hypothetical protein
MSGRLARHWRLAVLWALSLVVVGLLSASAQQGLPTTDPQAGFLVTETTSIVSGDDIGFRVERTANGLVVGRVVVRVDGVWVDTVSPVPVR